MKLRIALVSALCALLFCSCSAEDASGSREAESSDGSSAADTQTSAVTSEQETASSETALSASSEEDSSAYFPELLKSAAAPDADSPVTDFDRMIKDVASFDWQEYAKDHNYVLEHFTGRIWSETKMFLIYERKAFIGIWQYGKYILRMFGSTENYVTFIVQSIYDQSSGYVPQVMLRGIDNTGKDYPLKKEVTREDIDSELRMAYHGDPDSISDSESDHYLPAYLFDDSVIYDEDEVSAFIRDIP